MSMDVNVEINIENLNEIKEIINKFPNELKESLFRRYQRVANREEKILKSTTGFRDRTGRLRSELMTVATYNPLGIQFGTFTPYAPYVAFGHGTWKGSWWLEYIKGLSSRLPNDIKNALDRTVKDFNSKYSEV